MINQFRYLALRNHKCGLQNLNRVRIVFFATQSDKQKDSNWIYSSKYDEMKSMYKGKVFVTTDTGNFIIS
jgi:hypothetical protein